MFCNIQYFFIDLIVFYKFVLMFVETILKLFGQGFDSPHLHSFAKTLTSHVSTVTILIE